MKVNYQIGFQEESECYRMNMLNGTVIVPKIPGAYNIATGCGSGKTTIIKQIIEQKYCQGVIVFCKTIAECNELYDFTIQNVIPHSYGNLLINEVTNLCSEPRIEEINGKKICTNGVDNGWKDDLDSLNTKKVVIATHSVLMNTPLDKLLNVTCTSLSTSEANLFQKAFGINTNIRQFMLIDELPLHEPLQMTIPIVGLIMRMKTVTVLRPNWNNPGQLIKTTEFRKDNNETYSNFKASYEMLEHVDSSYRINKSSNELNTARKEMLLSSLYVTMEKKVNESYKNGKSTLTVKYGLQPMLMSGVIPINLWIFEGTGDLTLSTNERCRFMSYPNKYAGEKVDVIKISNSLKSRSIDIDKMFRKKDDIISKLNENAELLKNIVKCNNETLIIVWKNLRAKYVQEDEKYNLNLSKFILNDEFDLVEYYKTYLENCGELNDKKFHIIHYGSGKDLATNEFRNCDSIVRLGLFQIPNDGLRSINDDLGTEMDMKQFILYQNIQALSRTHIRLHEGKPIKFYVSDDYGNHIDNLINYLKYEGVETTYTDITFEEINKKVLDKLHILFKYDSNILLSILSNSKYSLTITLDEIYNLIPMTKEIRKYSNIINELDRYGIKLNIVNSIPL